MQLSKFSLFFSSSVDEYVFYQSNKISNRYKGIIYNNENHFQYYFHSFFTKIQRKREKTNYLSEK